MNPLSEEEKRELIRRLLADAPLPDEYRFSLFASRREPELVWEGKPRRVDIRAGKFRIIERVGAAEPGEWVNKLVRGDNKLVLASLINGSAREEIERQGGLKLVYIDPPFDVGADFLMEVENGAGAKFARIAYSDVWGRGADSLLSHLYERLRLVWELLADDGCVYAHCDWRFSPYLRLILDEIFKFHVNEIIWHYTGGGRSNRYFSRKHDSIFVYSKTGRFRFNADAARIPYKKTSGYARSGIVAKSGKRYLPNSAGTLADDVWDIPIINPLSRERTGYPTQKPEALIERIVGASSREGDLVADFYCGSGTLPAIAEKLGRKWIAVDSGKFAIHTTMKRLLGVRSELKKAGELYRPFEVLIIDPSRRSGSDENSREEETRLEREEADFLELILKAYDAEKVEGLGVFRGEKRGRMVAVGPINGPVSRHFMEEILLECRARRISRVDLLGFEFETGLFPDCLTDARRMGADIRPKYIPREIFDKRAVARDRTVFRDLAYIKAAPVYRDGEAAIELKDFSLFYSSDSLADPERELTRGDGTVVEKAEMGKDKDATGRDALAKNWTDWIDYWAVDYNFESEREIINVNNPETDETEERRTGDYIFKNEWRSFRTKKDRRLELISAFIKLKPGRYKMAVRIVDIFGDETTSVIEAVI